MQMYNILFAFMQEKKREESNETQNVQKKKMSNEINCLFVQLCFTKYKKTACSLVRIFLNYICVNRYGHTYIYYTKDL